MSRNIYEIKPPAATEKFQPDPELLRRLKTIAKIVGGDFGMSVEIGQPGKGSFFDPEAKEIRFDPVHFSEGEEWRMEFIAGHEGGHRAIDRSPRAIGGAEIEKQWEKLGWGFLANCVADCADNSWVIQKFPAFREQNEKIYSETFEKENAILGNPQVHALAAALGRAPKFAQFGSELMRYWFKGEFSQNLNPKVKSALEQAIAPAQEAWKALPESGFESEILKKARERYSITRRRIWPLMKELIEEDETNEALRQMVKSAQKEKKNGEKKESGEGSAPLDLPPELQKELEEKMEEGRKKYEEDLKQKEDELNDKLEEAKSKAAGAEEGLEKERARKEMGDLEKEMEKVREAREDLENGEAMPLDMDGLSDELKEKLKEAFDKLPYKEKRDVRDKARKILEEFEDELNEDLEAKLGEEIPKKHRERREEREKEQSKKEQEKKDRETRVEIERRIEEKMTDYQKVLREVKPIIDKTYKYLEKFFIPQRHPRFLAGFDSGSRAQTQKVMQFEAKTEMRDSSARVDFWERKTKPKKLTTNFLYSMICPVR